MPDTSTQQNPDFNSFLSQNIAGLDTAIKKYVPPDPEGAARINKERGEIKKDEDKIAFPTAPPEKQNSDPLQTMGSAAGWIATLGSLLTRQPLTSALNSSAAAIQAANAGDQKAYENAMEKWKANDQLIKDQHEWISDKLKNAKTDEERALQARALGFPGVDTFIKMPGGIKMLTDMYIKSGRDYEKSKDTVRSGLDEKIEVNSYVNGKLEEAKAINPSIKPEELNKIALQARGEAKELAKGGNFTVTPEDEEGIKFRTGLAATGDPTAFQNIGRGKSGDIIRNKIWSSLAKLPDMTPEKLAALHLKFRSLTTEEGALGAQTAKLGTSGEEFDRLANLAEKASNNVNRTEYPTLNKAIEAVDQGTGDTNVVALVTNARGAVNTWARAINPNGVATVEATQAGTHLLDVGYSKGQFSEALKQMRNETKAAREAPAAVQKSIEKQIDPEKQKGPKTGEIEDGYRFKGGDPSDPKNWELAR